MQDRMRLDLAANSHAAFDRGGDPQREEDGDFSLYPNITIGGAMVFAYVANGMLTVSIDLDNALDGPAPVWAVYGPADDLLVPVRISVQGTEVFRAGPEGETARSHADEGEAGPPVLWLTPREASQLDLALDSGPQVVPGLKALIQGAAHQPGRPEFGQRTAELREAGFGFEADARDEAAARGYWGITDADGAGPDCADHGGPPHRHDSDGEPSF